MADVGRTTSDLTVKEFAQQTNQAEQSVYRQCRLGKIPSYRVGGSVRIRREDADALRQPRSPRYPLSPELLAEIRRAVDKWPPLTADQRAAVAALFTTDSGDL